MLEDEDHGGCYQHDNSGGDGEGEPVAVAGFDAGNQVNSGVDFGVDFGV
jgi:hypothetical protein